jgi:hypothetical protein
VCAACRTQLKISSRTGEPGDIPRYTPECSNPPPTPTVAHRRPLLPTAAHNGSHTTRPSPKVGLGWGSPAPSLERKVCQCVDYARTSERGCIGTKNVQQGWAESAEYRVALPTPQPRQLHSSMCSEWSALSRRPSCVCRTRILKRVVMGICCGMSAALLGVGRLRGKCLQAAEVLADGEWVGPADQPSSAIGPRPEFLTGPGQAQDRGVQRDMPPRGKW